MVTAAHGVGVMLSKDSIEFGTQHPISRSSTMQVDEAIPSRKHVWTRRKQTVNLLSTDSFFPRYGCSFALGLSAPEEVVRMG